MTAQLATQSSKLIDEINSHISNGVLNDVFVQRVKNAAINTMAHFPFESHILLSFVDAYHFNHIGMKEHMRIAINLKEDATTHINYATSCALANLPHEAAIEAQKAHDLEPHNPYITEMMVGYLINIGEIEKASKYMDNISSNLSTTIATSMILLNNKSINIDHLRTYTEHAWEIISERKYHERHIIIQADLDPGYEGVYYDFCIGQDADTCAELTTELISRIASDMGVENMPSALNISFSPW
ncbi:hypothetical protein HF923_01495 [Acidithiobacillus ferriphilus]|uniref:tetratricopeptide repeat protein n=1 Tax=Acidithiobacillus ferriphilus TaxID=1689834 RepID=UPI001C06E895|nr:hypothetical protein [Acidithiobacillus ferriphilus]MBU2844525.1 hypothetical protein [Acidithiobacillus ferriphilus]